MTSADRRRPETFKGDILDPLAAITDPLLVILLGPTASGKTALSLALAERFSGEIISCDSVAVYRGMDLGSAKPSPLERARVRHHLIDITTPDRPYTAGDYSRDARSALAGITARGRLPIVTGGTGLYLRALLEGLFAGPQRSEPLRARLRDSAARHAARRGAAVAEQSMPAPAQQAAEIEVHGPHDTQAAALSQKSSQKTSSGPPSPVGDDRSTPDKGGHRRTAGLWLHRLLGRIDPASAARIHPHDEPKLIRALEISICSRQPLSTSLAGTEARNPLTGYRILRIGLAPDRADLYDRINRRAAEMFAAGLVEETRGLLARYQILNPDANPDFDPGVSTPNPHLPVLTVLGYRQATRVLAGETTLSEAVAEAQQGHRNYAKRQMTWFRREPEVQWLAGFGDAPEVSRAATRLVEQHLS